MKSCILLLLGWSTLFTRASSHLPSLEDHINMVTPRCQAEHKVTTDEIETFPKEFDPDEIERRFKCFTKCLLEASNIFEENGKIDGTKFLNEFGENTEENLQRIDDCKAEHDFEDDQCEYVFRLLHCLIRDEEK